MFGLKGGAAGGGYSQVLPMEEINLHFTGDIHAVTAANNLLSALIDNHIHQGNALRLDPERIVFRRCMDMNDRSLRKIEIGLGGKANGTPRFDGFQISVASEVMAILCLAKDLKDLRERLGRILVGYTVEGKPVFAHDLQAEGAMAALLREALRPNLVQTLEHTPCLMHGGPFANIAHGCNSVRATRLALTLADYTVTEAGFGSDLGAEKFFDIKCPAAGITPAIAVLVVTVRALRYNGGCDKESCRTPNAPAVAAGLCNLTAHVENLRQYGVPVVVAINRFPDDLPEELADALPPADTVKEADYRSLVTLLAESRRAIRTQEEQRYGDMVDYYTMWAHQIKTPIASMRLTLQNEDSGLARSLSGDLMRVEQYVEMVLVFLRLDRSTTDYVIRSHSLDDIVRPAVREFAGEFIRRRLRLDYQPLDRTVVTDAKWLGFVVEQVLSNALKYTVSGSVTIAMDGDDLCIRDTGMGIAPEDLPRIFVRGFTGLNGRRDTRASGIGLYLCRRICRSLGHTIRASSVPNQGTEIRIGLGQKKTLTE